MSTLKIENTTIAKSQPVMIISGKMTSDFNQMKKELAGQHQSIFGDAKKVISKFKRPKLTHDEVMDLYNCGTNKNFYNSNKIWGYFCVRPSDYSNYMFSHIDCENRDNLFLRMRNGVLLFHLDKFDIYMIGCA